MRLKYPRRVAIAAAAIIVATALAVVSSSQTQLQFQGMNSVFGLTKYSKSGLMRQPDCSITQYGFSLSTRMLIPATHFQDTLHQLAGLTTKPDVFAKGCKDPVLGVASTATGYLGKSAAGLYQGVQGATDHVANLVVYGVNPSSLTFTSTTLATNVTPQILAVDLNKDGFIDVIATGVTDPTTKATGVGVFLSKGDGTFKPGVVYAMTASATQAFIVDDLNGDGVPDILVPNTAGGGTQLTALLGKGDGSFTTGPSTAITLTLPLTLYGLGDPIATGDFNGDGKIDVLTADGKLYLGKGDGSFGAGTQALPTSYSITTAYAVGDFNGDGKLDVAELSTGINPSGTVIVFLGKGDGTFTQGFAYDSVPEGTAMVATDIDGDGNLDLVVGRSSNGAFGAAGLGNQTTANTWFYQILMGHGDGTFNAPSVTLTSAAGAASQNPTWTTYATADFNKDGRLDLLLPLTTSNGSSGPIGFSVSPGVGTGAFGSPIVSTASFAPSIVAAADLNGDGNIDAVGLGSNVSGPIVGVLFGHGDGTLSGELDYALPASGTGVVVGDFNGDGFPDIAVAVACDSSCTAGVYVLYGQSNHTFTAPALINSSPALNDGATQMILSAGDINGDGLTDLLVVDVGFLSGNGLTTPGVIHVYLGKSNNSFTATSPAVPNLYFSDVVLADLNKDGKLDIVAGASDQNFNTQVDVLLGHGDGSFAAATQTLISGGQADPAPVLAVADFDGDGNPDVAFFLAGDFSGVLFGAGNGTLPTQVKMSIFSPVFPGAATAVDLNGDGKPDLMFADANLPGVVSMINQWGLAAGGGAATSTTLSAAPNPATAGEAVTLTAKVTSSAAGTPTGTVNFLAGTNLLGSSAVSAQGSATMTTASLTAGTQSLIAEYGGDSAFAGSSSAAVSVTVSGAKPDFAIALAPTVGSVAAGASATVSVTLTPSGGFSGAVALACSGAPAGAACSFSPSSVSLNGAAGTAMLTISTATRVAKVMASPRRSRFDPFVPTGTVLAGVLVPLTMRRRRPRSRTARAFSGLGLLLICGVALHGCGGGGGSSGKQPMNGGTPAGTYTVTVTATSGSTSHAATYSLTVT
jgi:hypothetical protein